MRKTENGILLFGEPLGFIMQNGPGASHCPISNQPVQEAFVTELSLDHSPFLVDVRLGSLREKMRVLLRDFRTGLYVGRGRKWTGNPQNARTFSNRFRANAFKVCHGLPAAALVAVPRSAGTKLRPVFAPPAASPPVPASSRRTLVRARIELGAGNGLFIRGDGEGLNWDQGQTMAQLDSTTWMWSAHPAQEAVVFQLLLNDLIWAKGDNVTLDPGAAIDLMPDFEWPEIPRMR